MTARDVLVRGRTFRLRSSGEGRSLLFLHGLGSDGRDVTRDLGELPGYQLVAVDQRGHGDSTPVRADDEFTLDALVDDLDALLDQLPADTVLGGGSMGAAVLTRWALRHPDSGRTLLFVVPALGVALPPGIGAVRTFVERVDQWGRARAAELTYDDIVVAGFSDEVATAALAPWLRQDEESLQIAMRSLLRWQLLHSWTQLRAIRAPAGIVAVQGDPLHPVEVAQHYATELPDARLRVISDPLEAARPGRIGVECGAVLRDVMAAVAGGGRS